MEYESSKIEAKFAKLASSIHQSLITRNVPRDRLVACLMGFSCLTKVFDGGDYSVFHKQRRKFTDPTTTVSSVWIIVAEYFSFFDYEVLELIVDDLGDENDKRKVAGYRKDFEAYAKRRMFIDQTKTENEVSPGEKSTFDQIVYVMLDSSYDDCDVGHLKKLQEKLSNLLKLKRGVLRLRKVRKGSIQVLFQIPDVITDIIFPLSPDQESALRELRVTQLDCRNYHFRAKV